MPNKDSAGTKSVPKLDKKVWRLGGILVALILIIVLAVVFTGSDKPAKTAQNCGPYRDDGTVTINGATFKAETPKNQAEFSKGLGGRPCILPDQAMIFRFPQSGQYAFWMKGMKFPIDILWINSNHQIVYGRVGLQPASYPIKFVNPQNMPAQYILEMKANRSKEIGARLGTIVQF